jgi:ethanolamine ammonia-lyase small subunit
VGRRRSDTERQVPAPAGPAPSAAANAGEAGGVEGAKAAAALPDCWAALRALTPARLALGRAGASLPTGEVLRFGWDHAQARDAVQRPLDIETLQRDIAALGLATLQVASRAPDRVTYLMRPDLGRRLDEKYASGLQSLGRGWDMALVVADGLSSSAVQRHAPAVLEQIVRSVPKEWRLAPVIIAAQARPGLSSPDSLGIYLTWQPRIGRSDAERNCISNIRPEGLSYEQAARKLVWLCREARRMKLSGVGLKDRSNLVEVVLPTLLSRHYFK